MIAYKLTTATLKKSTSAMLELNDSVESFSLRPKIFTTFIAHLDEKQKRISIRFLEKHRQRLINQAKEINLDFTKYLEENPWAIENALLRIFAENFANFTSPELIMRIVLQTNVLEIFIDSYQSRFPNKRAISLFPYWGERYLPHLKTSVTKVSRLALKNAREQDCDEALLLNNDNQITECAWANIFWVDRGNNLCTTKSNILEGINRNEIINSFPCILKDIDLQGLFRDAKEVFITQSTTGITAVKSIDNKIIGGDESGNFTKKISSWYAEQGEKWKIS